jgi:hypothetical protein
MTAKAKPQQHRWRTENPKAKCPRHNDKDYRLLIKAAWDEGWKCVKKKKYIHCYPPDETKDGVWVPMTPSSQRRLRNVRANFKAAGLPV